MESLRFLLHKNNVDKKSSLEELPKTRAEHVLEKVDFNLLRNIFAEQMRKSAVDADDINFQTPQKGISLKTISGHTYSEYWAFMNKISIDPNKMSLETDISFNNQIFSVLCHEETHSVSTSAHHRSFVLSLFNTFTNRPSGQSGLEYTSIVHDIVHDGSFGMFNEAVTDSVAEEVFGEYIKRSGDRVLFSNPDGIAEYSKTYLNERNIFKAFICALSRTVEIPEDVVWSGVKQSYFSNANLAKRELVKLFEEVLKINISNIIRNPTKSSGVSQNAIQQLENIGSSEVDIFSGNLAKSIETMSWSDELIKRATDALRTLISPKRK